MVRVSFRKLSKGEGQLEESGSFLNAIWGVGVCLNVCVCVCAGFHTGF